MYTLRYEIGGRVHEVLFASVHGARTAANMLLASGIAFTCDPSLAAPRPSLFSRLKAFFWRKD